MLIGRHTCFIKTIRNFLALMQAIVLGILYYLVFGLTSTKFEHCKSLHCLLFDGFVLTLDMGTQEILGVVCLIYQQNSLGAAKFGH